MKATAAENSLGKLAKRWWRIGQRVAYLERANRMLRESDQWQKTRIQELEAELLECRPNDTKWGWLWWTLGRPELISVRVNVGDERTVKATRSLINSAMSMHWAKLRCRVHVNHVGDHVFDVSRGERWMEYDGRELGEIESGEIE